MTDVCESDRTAVVGQFFADLSIRWKLALSFGMLLLLGIINIGVYYWGAHSRDEAWQEVQQAIQRQVLVTDVLHQLQDQKQYVDILTTIIGVQDGEPPSASEQERFAQVVDSISSRLAMMIDLAPPDRRASIVELYDRTRLLGESWIRFYNNQWTNPSEAITELYVTAEPLSDELLTVTLPSAVESEKNALAAISRQFEETDRTFSRIAWISFLLSALIGGAVAFGVTRDTLRKISVLKAGAERLGAGELDHRIVVLGRDELGDVTSSFNEMARRLKERTDELAARRDQVEAQRDDLEHTLSNLRATQARLVQQEKLASLGALTAGIAHEIKNPLNFINNFAALCEELAGELEEELALDDLGGRDRSDVALTLQDLKINAAKIREHGQRADRIVRSMLLHSRGEPGERRPTEINTLVEESVNLAFHGLRAQNADFSVEIERRLGADVGEVLVVPQELGRVFINLLSNSFYAVHLKASQENDEYVPRVTVETRRRGASVEVEVADNGPGIPAELRERIFDPFYTTKPAGEGTGLGLSLSYDIVTQLHGGTIELVSEEGKGSSFIVMLPDKNGQPTV